MAESAVEGFVADDLVVFAAFTAFRQRIKMFDAGVFFVEGLSAEEAFSVLQEEHVFQFGENDLGGRSFDG